MEVENIESDERVRVMKGLEFTFEAWGEERDIRRGLEET